MAETSGFATDLPQSTYLANTIRRAISAAQQRSHRYVTLEHLLLALLDDPDALALLEAARADMTGLSGAVTETVNHNLATLYTPGEFDLRASYKVERVLQSASDDARRMGCTEVDGAFVAVALFHETDSPAYDLLKRHNFVFHAANGWLDRNRGIRSRPQAPAAEAGQVEAEFDDDDELEELEPEILLEEVIEEAEPAARAEPAPARAVEEQSGDPEPDDDTIEPVRWPVIRPGARPAGSPAGDGEVVWSRGSPLRPVTTGVEAEPQPREEPRLDPPPPSRQPASGQTWEIGPAIRRPSLDRSIAERELRSAERPSPMSESPKPEPRLTTKRSAGRSFGEAGVAVEIQAESQPVPAGPGLGSTVPARETPSPASGESADAASGRRPHASARERSVSAARPVLTPPSQDGDGPPNDISQAGHHSERRPQAPGAAAGPSPAPAAARPEAPLPPAARLDNMRVRPAPAQPAAVPAPAPARAPARKAARDKDGERARGRRRPSAGAVYAGKLAENIPRKMRAHVRVPVEVRISREETEAFLAGFEGVAEPVRHQIAVTQAMSVMLRAPDGGFTIENLGPETQWIFRRPGPADKEGFGRWMWSVTPTETGRRRLQLVVASRSVDENGLAGDTALPEQVITVRVRANYVRGFVRAIKWVVLMALGGAVTEGTLLLMRLVG